MNVRQQLTLEQQFGLQVFESQIRELSPEDTHALLVELKQSMMYQTTAYREILKDAWGIGKGLDDTLGFLPEG